MTNTELLAKIKNEIERRIRELDEQIVDIYDSKAVLRKDELQKLLSLLSDLEKLEKPMDGLEDELKDYLRRYYNCDYPKQIEENTCSPTMPHIVEAARHFAQWGAEHFRDTTKMIGDSSEIPADLEEASSKFATHTAPNGVSIEFLEEKLSFQEGAKWDRQQIMKNAKDGWLDEDCVIVLNDGTRVDLQPDYEKKPAFEFEYAQDVRVIVLPKED